VPLFVVSLDRYDVRSRGRIRIIFLFNDVFIMKILKTLSFPGIEQLELVIIELLLSAVHLQNILALKAYKIIKKTKLSLLVTSLH
jgi:hypothetical protein